MIGHHERILGAIKEIHSHIRDEVLAECERSDLEELQQVAEETEGDTIFRIDKVSEEVLLREFAQLATEFPLVLIAEGVGEGGRTVLPIGTSEEECVLRVIVDPIDGTRGLMYQKRAAWILTGVAPNKGESTSMRDIEVAVQTEIPLIKQHLSDSLWAVRGQGAHGERLNRLTRESAPLHPAPSRAASIEGGYGQIARFFPGGRGVLATIEDELVERVLGPIPPGKAQTFEDQNVSTGGQLYELVMGHDRWVADLRSLVSPGLCCHPYDLCTELIAREAGVIVTDEHGRQIAASLDVTSNVSWIGYANDNIRQQVWPTLHELLTQHGLLHKEY